MEMDAAAGTGPSVPIGTKRKVEEVETCEELCRLLKQQVQEALAVKRRATRRSSLDPKAVRTGAGGAAGSLLLLRLREANWEAHFEMEERKELTKRAKATLDDLNLQLQNLVYEEAHYNKEIQHCRDFRPREVVHDLLPAPPSGTEAAAKPDEDEESRAHRLMTQRLAAELEERKRLCKEVEALTSRKAALQEANQAKRKFLHGLRSRLQTIAQAAEPAQQHFGYTSTEKTDSFDTAGQLPAPLYTLFAQLNAHKLAFDTGIGVSVGGDAEAALALNAQLSRRGSTVATRLMAERTESQTDKPHQFAIHPLAVLLHFPNGDDMAQGVALKLRFEYLYELNVVGVRVEHGDETLLHNLYPRDIGLTSPNPANRYLFNQEVSIKQGYPGRAYKWAQWAAGLGFAQEERGLPGRPHVASIIQRLKARIRDHRSLNTQLNLLGKGMIPGQPHAALHIWKEISAAEFQASELLGAAGAAGLEEGELGSRTTGREAEGLPWHCYASRHFYALLKKPEFELEVFARVGTEYPYRPPEWRLRWKVYNGKRGWVPYTFPASVSADAHPTALDAVGRASPCDNQLKALEMRLNSAWDTKQGEESMLLSHQCVVLQTGFERLVEACRSTTAPGRSRTPLHGRARLAPIV